MTGPTTVLVMAKAPRAGLVKTRLHPLLGPEGCARLQAELLRHTVGTARACGCRVVVAFDPPDARGELRALIGDPGSVTLIPQRGRHLGERMTAAARDAMPHGGALVVIGTDAPTLTWQLLDQAACALEAGSGSVLGPALDGGYYLLGVHWPRPEAFAIDPALWSGEHVAAATLEQLERHAGHVTRLPMLRDADTPDDAAVLAADPLLPAALVDLLAPTSAAEVTTR